MNKRGDCNIGRVHVRNDDQSKRVFDLARVHVAPIAMSPIQGDTAGTERATSWIRQLFRQPMYDMPTGDFFLTIISWRACRRASSTAWPTCCKCHPAPACDWNSSCEGDFHHVTTIYIICAHTCSRHVEQYTKITHKHRLNDIEKRVVV